jgi:putative transposase
VDRFNVRFRDELLDRELSTSLKDTSWVVDRWRLDYKHHMPQSALRYQTPAAFAARYASSFWATPSLQNCSDPLNPDPLIQTGK